MSPHTLQNLEQRRGVEEALQHAGMCGRKSAAALALVTWFAVMGTGSDAGKVLHV